MSGSQLASATKMHGELLERVAETAGRATDDDLPLPLVAILYRNEDDADRYRDTTSGIPLNVIFGRKAVDLALTATYLYGQIRNQDDPQHLTTEDLGEVVARGIKVPKAEADLAVDICVHEHTLIIGDDSFVHLPDTLVS